MPVTGYASATSVVQGGTIAFFLSSTPAATVRLTLDRIGSVPAATTMTVSLVTQSVPAIRAWEGFRWSTSVTFRVPETFPTGLYRLMNGAEEILTFVVRQAVPGSSARLLVAMPYLRHAAYNSAGGKSLYGYNSLPRRDEASRATQVSLNRPGGTVPADGPESRLVRWLDAEGIGAEYCSNVDLHTTPALLTAYDCLIIVWHDEYWSKPMRDQVERFVAGGGNLIVLSGNTCYRAIRLERGNRMVVFHKYASSDPVRDAETTTVAWAEPPVNRPQNRFLGVGFTDGAYGGSAAPFTVRFPSHWLFAGVAATTTVPFMGYEADAAAYVFETEGYPRVTGDEGTPLTFTVLADADLSHWTGKPGRVTMGLYSKHGTVFNVATTDWLQNLSDPVIAQITRNALRRLGSRLPRDWELIGHARNGVALASTDGRLYLASSANRLWRRFPIRADVPWRDVGHANHVVAMAGLGGTLYCVTADNRLWSRAAGDADVDWTPIRFGPPSGTRALAATGGFLYAVDPAGRLSRRPASATGMADSGDSWRPVTGFGADATVCALTAYGDILIAATSDNRLLRSNRDFIAESTAWHRIHHCNGATGLAVVEWMLYVITSSHAIWQMDLYGLSEP